jgi:hypothetical protein
MSNSKTKKDKEEENPKRDKVPKIGVVEMELDKET